MLCCSYRGCPKLAVNKPFEFEFEVEQLTWKLRKMEESRRVYEDATSQLGSFLELVSSQLTVSGRWVC